MRRLAVALALLAVSGALVFPSAAAPLGADVIGEDVDAASGQVHLTPSDGPNGDYARLDGGELVIDLTAANSTVDAGGVNANAVTRFAGVFEIEYDGTEYAEIWIRHDAAGVTFRAGGDPIQSEENTLTLGPEESATVDIVVDTRGTTQTADLIEGVEVHARIADPAAAETETTPSDRSYEDLYGNDSSDGEATVQQFRGSATERSIRITNPPANGSTTVDLGGMNVDRGTQANVTLDELDLTTNEDVAVNLTATSPASEGGPGVEPLAAVEVTEATADSVAGATLRFSADREFLDQRGVAPDQLTVVRRHDGTTSTLPVRIVGTRDGRVVFEAETPGFSTFTVAALQPSISVADAALSTNSLDVNDTATVTARVSNDGRVAGTRTVTATVDGTTVASRTVSLDAGESTTVRFDLTPQAAGEYAVAVDGVAAGTLAVNDAGGAGAQQTESETETDAPVEEPAGLGLEGVVGLVFTLALVLAVLALVRRAPR